MKPVGRTQNLIIEKVGDETVVYDSETHKAHSLNRVAEAVWRACDGQTTPEQIADRLRNDFGPSADLSSVERALHDLGEANLLHQAPPLYSRREVSAGAAALVPVVASLLIPPAAAAKSGKVKDRPDHPNHPDHPDHPVHPPHPPTPKGKAFGRPMGVPGMPR